MGTNELLSLSRTARRLGVTQQWLRQQAEAGAVPSLKAGNRYLFNHAAVEEALAAKAAESRQGVPRAK
jgi:excisionase family DNA binding protein